MRVNCNTTQILLNQYLEFSSAVKMYSLRIYLIATVLICVLNETIADQYKIVETFNGKIRGIQKLTFLNKIPFYSFKGIPYAKSPTGDLRFKVRLKKNLLKYFHFNVPS